MTPSTKQNGFSLIEVLVTMLIISVGLLGMVALQLNALKQNQNALQLTTSTLLANEITDRMRANQTAAADGNYNIGTGAIPSGGSVADNDLLEWKTNLASQLPAGDGSVELNGVGAFTITIVWDDSKGVNAPVEYQLETRL